MSFCDYLYQQLHGTPPASSSSIASGTGLLDLTTRGWDAELVEVLRVDEERLPALSNEPEAGWYPALIDGACSNLGAGCVGRSRAALMIGTSGALRVLYETEVPEPRPGLFLYLLDERRVVEGGALSDGGNLHAWLNATLTACEGSVLERGPDRIEDPIPTERRGRFCADHDQHRDRRTLVHLETRREEQRNERSRHAAIMASARLVRNSRLLP